MARTEVHATEQITANGSGHAHWVIGGVHYTYTNPSDTDIRVLSASDPTGTWTSQDTVNIAVSSMSSILGCSAYFDGTNILFAYAINDQDVGWVTYTISTDTFGSLETIDTMASANGTQIDITKNDAGEVVVVYTVDVPLYMGIPHKEFAWAWRSTGGTWTTAAVYNTASDDFQMMGLSIVAAGGRVHATASARLAEWRVHMTFRAAHTYSTVEEVSGEGLNVGMAGFFDGTTVFVPSVSRVDGTVDITSFTDADTPTTSYASIDSTDVTPYDLNSSGGVAWIERNDYDTDDMYLMIMDSFGGTYEWSYYENLDGGGWDAAPTGTGLTVTTAPGNNVRFGPKGGTVHERSGTLYLAWIDNGSGGVGSDGTGHWYCEISLGAVGAATQAEDELTLLGCGGGG